MHHQLIEVGELGFLQLEPLLSFQKIRLLIQVAVQKRMEFWCWQHLLIRYPNLQDLGPIVAIIFLHELDIQCLNQQQIGHEVECQQLNVMWQIVVEEHRFQQLGSQMSFLTLKLLNQVKELKHMEFQYLQKQFAYLQNLPCHQPKLASSFHL